MKAKITKWGNSVAVRLPKAALEAAGLQAGAEVDVVVEGRELRLKQVVRTPHYTLEELLAEMDRLDQKVGPSLSIGARTWGRKSSMTTTAEDSSLLRAGDLMWVDLRPTRGREQGGVRPAVVLTDREYHRRSDTAIVGPGWRLV